MVCHGRPSPSLRGVLRWPCHRCSSVLVAIRSSPAEGKLLLNRVGIVLSGRGEKARAGGQTLGQEGKLSGRRANSRAGGQTLGQEGKL